LIRLCHVPELLSTELCFIFISGKRSEMNPTFYLAGLALVLGALGGLSAVLFYYLIQFANWLFFDCLKDFLAFLGPLGVPVIGAAGGLLVGPLVYFFAREAKGHGVPEVMYAVACRGGRIRPRVVFIKAVASALTIGSGGSAGREGPIAQIGAALGSTVGQFLRLSERQMVALVACGAGAGISATFNTPIAGAIFALEVILGEFSPSTFGLAVISSTSAALVARTLLGNVPAFLVVRYDLVHPSELILYSLLGMAAAGIALLYIRVLYGSEDIFDNLKRIPEYVRPALGGVLFGVIGLFLPQTLGRGDDVIQQILNGQIHWVWFLALLCLAKLVTTSLTIGSGGSGGVFFPGLFIGACLGGALGNLFQTLLPQTTAGSGAYALVGMGALFAGMTQAPLTAILMLFEMSQDYRIILPLMLSCGVATLLARGVSKETIYTMKLARRGIYLSKGRDVNILGNILVRDAMATPVCTVSMNYTLREVIQLMQQTRHSGFPVVDQANCLVGMLTLQDIRRVEPQERLETFVRDAMTADPVVATPGETLEEVSRKFALREIGRVPVVEGEACRKVVGLITRSDIISAYNRRLLQSEEVGGSTKVTPQ
jgi:CIC family chloride channel protein